MRHVAGCLRLEGLYVVIDMFRAEGESREGYMARFKQHMDAQLSGRPWVGGRALLMFGWAPVRHGASYGQREGEQAKRVGMPGSTGHVP